MAHSNSTTEIPVQKKPTGQTTGFLLWPTALEKGGIYEYGRVTAPENVPFTLNHISSTGYLQCS